MYDMYQAALNLASREFAIIPVHGVTSDGACACARGAACDSPGKHPRLKGWPVLATTDQKIITQWWSMWPEANIGIATGRKSGIFVLDVDPRNGGDDSLEKLLQEIGDLPATLSARSGSGGLHFYFELPEGLQLGSFDKAVYPGLDIKGERGFVVAPPSLHRSGQRYSWR